VRSALTLPIMGYFDPMGTTAPLAGQRAKNRDEAGRLAEEQAALRRVATLVAQGASAAEVFAAVAREVAEVLHLANAAVGRYDEEGTVMTLLAVCGDRPDTFNPGSRWLLDGPSMSAEVLRTGRPARIEDYTDLEGSLAAQAREHGFNRVAGAPIIVGGRVWGVISTSSPGTPLPDDLEDRLGEFTELVATAIANSQAHEELTRLAEGQAALRRVATLVAQGAPPATVFEAVSAEIAHLVPADGSALTRFETDGTVTALGGWTSVGGYVHVGERFALEGTVSGLVFETRRPERINSYAEAPGAAAAAAREMGWRSSVGAPITVEGRLWGVLAVSSRSDRLLPSDTERRLAEFTELVATAIANAESREELTRLAEEQAALRRVATLVAEGARPDEVFAAVGDEVARILGVPIAVLLRYDPDGLVTVLATAGAEFGPVGSRWPIDGASLTAAVFETGRAARMDDYSQAQGPVSEVARKTGVRWGVGVPIIVDGALWGVMNAGSREPEPLVEQIEDRLAKFTQLLATAIANAESHAELDASRARIVATADATRRRIERDLHDGAQQQLLSLALEVRAAQAGAPPELREHRAELAHVAEGLTSVLDGLREIALGLHPTILAEGGLGPALKTLAHRSPITVELDVRVEGRLPERVEVAAYYVVSEALTNAAKYAQASTVHVAVEARDGMLEVLVGDDGLGGADPSRGSGLLGLKDRAEAIGGAMSLRSPQGVGTSLRVELPLDDRR
jgi:signal transduction histidine kinase